MPFSPRYAPSILVAILLITGGHVTYAQPSVGISEILYRGVSIAGIGEVEWIEVYNEGPGTVSLQNWTLEDPSPGLLEASSHTITGAVELQPGQYALLCESSSTLLPCDYVYGGIALNDVADEIVLRDVRGTVRDHVQYGGSGWPSIGLGEAVTFTGRTIDDNAEASLWLAETNRLGYLLTGSNTGTPRLRGAQQQLPVVASFTTTGGWRLLAPPLDGLTVADVAADAHVQGVTGRYPNAAPNVYLSYDAPGTQDTNEYWTPASSVDDALAHGRGYLLYVYGRDLGTTLSVDGPGPSGDVTASGLPTARAWHFMGNPFPNGLDVDGLDLAAQGFQTTVHVWDPGIGSYRLIMPIAGDDADAADDLAAHQGFFAEFDVAGWTGGSTTSLTFGFDHQASTRPTFYKRSPVRRSDDASGAAVRFRVAAYGANGEVARDEAAALVVREDASIGWDTWDATKLVPLGAPSVAISFPGVEPHDDRRAVMSLPLKLDGVRTVPVHLDASSADASSYHLSWTGLNSLPPWWKVELLTPEGPVDLRREAAVRLSADLAHTAKSLQNAPIAAGQPVAVSMPGTAAEAGKSTTDPAPLRLRIDPRLPELVDIWDDGRRIFAQWSRSNAVRLQRKEGDAFVDVRGRAEKSVDGTVRYESDPLPPGTHVYRVVRTADRHTEVLAQRQTVIRTTAPLEVRVGPTPVVDRATVTIRTSAAETVRAELFDVLGRRVAVLHDGRVEGGTVRLPVTAGSLSAGLYLLRVRAGAHIVTDNLVVAP